jgi:hypothetical protein
MVKISGILALVIGCCVTHAAQAQYSSSPDIFYGGGIGMAFGDIEYVEISPMVGARFNSLLSAGISGTYRWRSDTRFSQDIDTEDYGFNVFLRLHISDGAYLQAEYEYLDYEVYNFITRRTERRDYSSFLAGGGISQPIGSNTYAYATALYNFSYDDETDSPYDEPWVYRVGISVGF